MTDIEIHDAVACIQKDAWMAGMVCTLDGKNYHELFALYDHWSKDAWEIKKICDIANSSFKQWEINRPVPNKPGWVYTTPTTVPPVFEFRAVPTNVILSECNKGWFGMARLTGVGTPAGELGCVYHLDCPGVVEFATRGVKEYARVELQWTPYYGG